MSTKGAVLESAKPAIVPSSKRRPPSNEQIAVRAYELFLSRGASHGFDLEDWFQAEQELVKGN